MAHPSPPFLQQEHRDRQRQAKLGQVQILGITGDMRSPSLPEVPTFAEVGIHMKEMDFATWMGAMVPNGRPRAIVDKLNAAFNRVLQLPEASARAFGAACRGTPSSAPAINYRDPVPAVRCPKEAASVRRRPISRRQPNRGQTTGWTARYLAIIKLILGQLSSSNAPADGRCARR